MPTYLLKNYLAFFFEYKISLVSHHHLNKNNLTFPTQFLLSNSMINNYTFRNDLYQWYLFQVWWQGNLIIRPPIKWYHTKDQFYYITNQLLIFGILVVGSIPWLLLTDILESTNFLKKRSAEKRDKNGHLFEFVTHTFLVFLTSLLIFLPCSEVLSFMNCYFIVFRFKYHTNTHIFSLKILFWF